MPLGAPALRRARWGSLDALRGLALWLMLLHHLLDWTGGDARDRLPGFEGFAVTDLAAPMFAVGVGAAALLVGTRSGVTGMVRRWSDVLLLGLALDLANGGGIDGGGVLPALALLGVLVTLLAAVGVRTPAAWWGIAAVCALVAAPVTEALEHGVVGTLLGGPFALPVYGVFAAGGAAVAASAHGRGEEALPLLRAATAALVIAVIARALVPGLVAPHGIWPPARHPGDLAFTAWGLVATLVLWAAVRGLVPVEGRLGAGLARAGRRTLVVFGAHYVIRLALQHSGHLHELDTTSWELAACATAGAIAIASTIPVRRRCRRVVSSRDEIDRGAAVPVVRARVGGPGRSGPPAAVLQGELPPG